MLPRGLTELSGHNRKGYNILHWFHTFSQFDQYIASKTRTYHQQTLHVSSMWSESGDKSALYRVIFEWSPRLGHHTDTLCARVADSWKDAAESTNAIESRAIFYSSLIQHWMTIHIHLYADQICAINWGASVIVVKKFNLPWLLLDLCGDSCLRQILEWYHITGTCEAGYSFTTDYVAFEGFKTITQGLVHDFSHTRPYCSVLGPQCCW